MVRPSVSYLAATLASSASALLACAVKVVLSYKLRCCAMVTAAYLLPAILVLHGKRIIHDQDSIVFLERLQGIFLG